MGGGRVYKCTCMCERMCTRMCIYVHVHTGALARLNVHPCAFVCTHVHECACEGQGSTAGIFLSPHPFCFLRNGFSLSLMLRNSASRWAPETCLTLLLQRQGYINMCHHAWLFNRGSKSGTQVLMFAWQTLHRPSHLPDPCSYYFDFKYRSLMPCFSSLEAISNLHIAFPLS